MYSPSKKTSTHSVLPGMAVPVGRFLHTAITVILLVSQALSRWRYHYTL